MASFLLAGNSSFLKEETLQKIKDQLFSKGLTKIDAESFNAEENTLSEVLDTARTSPFFSSHRLVVLRNVDILKSPQLKEIATYLKGPQKTSTLVLITQDGKISSVWLETFRDLCQILLLNVPYEAQLDSWIIQRVRGTTKKIEPIAARLLKELVGSDLRTLAAEIQKLILYAGERLLITLQDVEELVTGSVHYPGFILSDALGYKDLPRSLSVLSRLLEEPKSVQEIIGLFYWQIQRMLQAKQKLQSGETWDGLTQTLRISSPFLIRKFQQQLSHWDLAGLKEAVKSLLEMDTAIKTGRWPGRLALENWLVESLH